MKAGINNSDGWWTVENESKEQRKMQIQQYKGEKKHVPAALTGALTR